MPRFADFPQFTPNRTPQQMFKAGVFGGTYWRPIYSGVNKRNYRNQHRDLPASWWNGIPEEMLSSPICNVQRNKYKVKSGTSLENWEGNGWIRKQDPYGWVQWYCRFCTGRRTADDKRQIKRWLSFAGPNGRFRRRLINTIKRKKGKYNDARISPVIRQALLQWGYELTKKDFEAGV